MKIPQNVKAIEALRAGEKEYRVSIVGIGNLALVVSPTGRKVWIWRGRVAGKPAKFTLGPFPAFSLARAKEWAAEHSAAQGQGRDIRVEKAAAEKQAAKLLTETVDWLFDLYMAAEGDSLRTAKARRADYVRDVQRHIGSRSIHSITYDDLADIVDEKVETAPVQANHIVTLLKRLFKWAVTSGRRQSGMRSNPSADLMKPTPINKRKRVLNEFEIGVFLHAVANPLPRYQAYADGWWLILHCGVRRDEAFGARFDEFNFETGEWLIPESRTKNETELLLPLPLIVMERLKEVKRKAGQELLWPTMDKHGNEVALSGWTKATDAIRTQMDALANSSGKKIDHWTMHDLRRTLVTGMNGLRDEDDMPLVDEIVVEKVVNHTLAGVKGVYNRYSYYRDKKRALALWADHLKSIDEKAQKDMDIAKAA